MTRKLIAEVGVNLDNADVKSCTSIYDIRKLELFEHLSDDKKHNAELELLEALGVSNEANED